MTVSPVRLNHGVLFVADLERSISFYSDAFGMTVTIEGPLMTTNTMERPTRVVVDESRAQQEGGREAVTRGERSIPARSPRGEAGGLVPVKQLLRWQDDGGATGMSAYHS